MACLFVALAVVLGSGRAVAYEEPVYRVVQEYEGFELREYAPRLVAETVVEGDFGDVGSRAFRVLFEFIAGKNRTSAKIAMTAPVTQEQPSRGTEIPMTAPVIQQPSEEGLDGRYVFRFVMPSEFTRETLPEPTDPRVQIRQLPAQRVAARRYAGFWGEKRYRKEEARLLDSLPAAGFAPIASPVFARYNSPFSLWFLRRNEVLVEVEAASSQMSP